MPHSPIVPAELDKRYRWAVVEYARNVACLPETLSREIEELLEGNTLPEGVTDARAEIADLAAVIQRATKIVNALAYFLGANDPQDCRGLGFIKWLGASGWGNDRRLILLMDAWYQEAQRRKLARRRINIHGRRLNG